MHSTRNVGSFTRVAQYINFRQDRLAIPVSTEVEDGFSEITEEDQTDLGVGRTNHESLDQIRSKFLDDVPVLLSLEADASRTIYDQNEVHWTFAFLGCSGATESQEDSHKQKTCHARPRSEQGTWRHSKGKTPSNSVLVQM